ncbi:ribosome-binding factor A [Oxobacter pfennigii]|uniref:Ribosome-binding factor A n=1 Tax=Oxobacter pfennigii TaxID=36849 RepID=A0A0P8YAC8_9CLOT|nr:30S ribosome-binding factor RbfA [Oxobacter pfennigii]KPU43901.1 ribosome-binding factor A [Oxobacter pfennigii]
MSFSRVNRINEEYKKEISDIIKNDIRDPRIAEFTSVVLVDVTKDLRYAKVYVSIMGDDKSKNDTIAGLKSAAGFIRKELGTRVKLRYTPEIIFELDNSIEYGMHINELLKGINKSEEDIK